MKVLKRIFTITIVILAFTTNMNTLQDCPSTDTSACDDIFLTEQAATGSDSIPLDGGLRILLAGAAVFGVRKLHKK